MITDILKALSALIIATISSLGYFGVFLMMGIESAAIPLPSEIIMPFSGYLVSTGEFSLRGAAFWGAAGCVAGLPTALIGDRVAPPLTGVAVGWLRTMTDVGHILGPVVMGALADAMDLSAPFVFAAVLLVTIALWCRRHAVALSAST